jgi:hypothetical protein
MDVCLHRSLYDTVRSYAQGKGDQREKEQEIHQKSAQSAESRKRSGLTTLSRRMAGIPPREPIKSRVCRDASLFLLDNKLFYWHNASETLYYH